jgi:transposase-like protein
VSQENKDKGNAAEVRTQETRGFMQQVRVAARRKYTPEEKVRIVLEGFRQLQSADVRFDCPVRAYPDLT